METIYDLFTLRTFRCCGCRLRICTVEVAPQPKARRSNPLYRGQVVTVAARVDGSRHKEMIMRVRCNITVLLLGISLIGLTTGCNKKVALAPPAPPPPLQEAPRPTPPGPTASITAEPPVIEAGQAVTLKWSTTNATEVTITAVGAVAVDGKQEVRPTTSTTYELVANGPGGSAAVSATVSVMAPPPPILPPPPVTSKSLQRSEEHTSELQSL